MTASHSKKYCISSHLYTQIYVYVQQKCREIILALTVSAEFYKKILMHFQPTEQSLMSHDLKLEKLLTLSQEGFFKRGEVSKGTDIGLSFEQNILDK